MKHINTTIMMSFVLCLTLLASCRNSASPAVGMKSKNSPDGKRATATLLHAPIGTADLTWNSQQHTLMVTMHMQGLAPNSTHPIHIHLGMCNAPSTMLYALPSLVANNLGQATMNTAVIKNVAHLPMQKWLINVHNGPAMVATQGQNLAIACGTPTMKESATSKILKEQVEMGSTTAPSESASGTANLSVDMAKTLSVSVKVHGLAPNTHHAVHIHNGSCALQGKMLYPLKTLIADTNGDASETVIFPNVGIIPASAWSINVHFSEAIATPQGTIIPQAYNPILCGNVHLS